MHSGALSRLHRLTTTCPRHKQLLKPDYRWRPRSAGYQRRSSNKRQSLGSLSPTGTYLEVISIPSSSSDHGWSTVDHFPNYDTYQQAQNAAIFNPGQTLHLRTHSDSSQSDGTGHTMETFGSFEDISYPYSPYSPDSDNYRITSTLTPMILSAQLLQLHLFLLRCLLFQAEPRPHPLPHHQPERIRLHGKAPPQKPARLLFGEQPLMERRTQRSALDEDADRYCPNSGNRLVRSES